MLKVKAMIWVIIAMVLISAWSGAVGASRTEDEYYIICKPKVEINVRERPGKRSAVIGHLMCGDSVKTDGKEKDGYLHVIELTFEETDGWIYKGLLVEEPPLIWEVKSQVCSKGRVAARKYIGGKRNRWLKDGKGVTIYAISEEWCITNYGYVRTEYLSINYGKVPQQQDGG